MPKINESERAVQNRVVQFFQNPEALGYTYYGNLQEQINKNIIPEKMIAWLTSRKSGEHSTSLSEKAVDILISTAGDLQHDLSMTRLKIMDNLKSFSPNITCSLTCENFVLWF